MQTSLDAAGGETAVSGALLDADYVTRGDGRAWVRLWLAEDPSTEDSGPRVVLDPSFEPYFYAVPADGVDAEAAAGQLGDLEADDGQARVVRTEVVRRKLLGREMEVVRVVVHHPGNVPPLREKARGLAPVRDVLEADVPFAYRYVIDRGLRPMDGVQAVGRVEEADGGSGRAGSGEVLVAESVEAVALDDLPELRTMAFDLEVYNPEGMPKERRDPIVICSVAKNWGPEGERDLQLTADDVSGEEGPAAKDDAKLVEAFVDLVRREDPEVLVTYNGDSFDWPYLLARAEVHGVDLPVGREGSTPDVIQAGPWKIVRVRGRANVDLYRVVARDVDDVKVKTLEKVADHLGVMDEDERAHVPKDEIARYWDDADDEGLRETLMEYAAADATSTLALADRLLPLQMELARHVRQSLEDVSKMGRGRQVEWYLRAEAHQVGEMVPNKPGGGSQGRYEGGFVLEPKQGVFEDVVCLDFSAMYPSIMMAYNISPDTLVTNGVGGGGTATRTGDVDAGEDQDVEEDAGDPGVWEAPEVGHRFRKRPDGFFKRIIQRLVEDRQAIKAKLGDLDRDDPAYTLLDIRQRTLKILTNSFYGYMGWPAARWYRQECAEATSAWGRHLIKQAVEKARGKGLEVYYGDTDSLFVDLRPEVEDLMAEVNQEMPVELEVDAEYEVIFFTSSKKRYAGLTQDGQIVVKGLEVRRGDWCELAKRVQREVIDIILRERDKDRAVAYVRDTIEALKRGDVDLEDVTIWKTLTMDPDTYKSKQAHAEAVARARDDPDRDYEPVVGAKVGYVILDRGHGLLSENSELVEFYDPDSDTLDYDYYVQKQVLPSAMRVLENFGVTENELLGRPTQQDLGDWF